MKKLSNAIIEHNETYAITGSSPRHVSAKKFDQVVSIYMYVPRSTFYFILFLNKMVYLCILYDGPKEKKKKSS